MPIFKYKAKNKSGQIYEKSVEAPDRLAIYGIIREEGGSGVLAISEVRSLSPGFSFSIPKLFGRISTQHKITLAKNLSSMINAGLPVTRALAVMSKQTKHRALKKLLIDIEGDLNHGRTLSDALGKRSDIFSPLFISMVKAGEESGSVANSLNIVANQMEKAHNLVKKVRGAMIYPAVIIGVMVILAILLLMFMVPTLTETFKGLGVKLPLPTRVLIFSSDFLLNNTIVVFSVMALSVVGMFAAFKSRGGRKFLDNFFLYIPVIGTMVREVQSARTARTLSSLLSAGVDIVVALGITSEVLQNHLYKAAIEHARNGIQKGETLSTIFSQYDKLYPVFVNEMIAVGEETGKISDMLLGVANFYEEEVDQKTKNLSTIIEPILMIIIGLGVGGFAISMLAPTYSLVDYI